MEIKKPIKELVKDVKDNPPITDSILTRRCTMDENHTEFETYEPEQEEIPMFDTADFFPQPEDFEMNFDI